MKLAILALLALSLVAHAQTSTLFTSDFNANSGAVVLPGNTDNTSGSASLVVTWAKHASVSSISGLTAISTGDSGTSGGFARLQNGSATYANTNNVFLSRNHNLDTNRATSKRGYRFSFTLDASWNLHTLTVISGHTNNAGTLDQDFSSKLNLSISGGNLSQAITGSVAQNYDGAPAYHAVDFSLVGKTLTAGTYALEVYQNDMTSAGAYAMFDGISLIAETPGIPVITSFATSDGYLTPGQFTTLSWQVQGADTLEISPNVGLVSGNFVSVSPTETTTYTLTARNAAGSSTATIRVAAGPPRPNILFFLVDDMGANDTSVPFLTDAAGNDMTTAGNAIYRTPNMATLAGTGMKFTRVYAMPVCTPSRVSLMTGMNSARHHVTDWTDVIAVDTSQNSDPTHRSPAAWRKQGLEVTPQLLPKLLGNAGYRTISVGKAHFGNTPGVNIDPSDIGFDVNIGGKETGRPGSYLGKSNFGSGTYRVPGLEAYHGQEIFLTEALTLEMNKEIEKSVTAGVPFFAYMSHYAVHDPYDTDNRFAASYPSLSGNAKAFATLIEGMDKSLGDIVEKLRTLGVAEDTLIVFLSDNGSTLPRGDDPRKGYKGQKYEGGTRVPMIVGWAKTNSGNTYQAALDITPASRNLDIVSINDIFPTLLATAGVPAPAIPLDGIDISGYLRGTAGFRRPQELAIHFPHDHNGAWGDYYSVFHEGDFKLIHNDKPNSYELYDLRNDPHEDSNLSPSQPERVMEMARKLARELHAQNAQWSRFSSNLEDDPLRMPILPGVDLDGDGLGDNAEDPDRDGLRGPLETDPDNADSDSDDTPDGVEIRTGTNPLDSSSAFRTTISRDGTTAELSISWPSKPGASYCLENSTNLAPFWETLAADVPAVANGSVTSFPVPSVSGVPRMFYRAVLK